MNTTLKMIGWIFVVGSMVSCRGVQTEIAITDTPSLSEPQSTLSEELPSAVPTATAVIPVEWRMEVVAEGLYVPWSIVFTDEDRMLVSERNGNIREINVGVLAAQPVYQFSDVAVQGEAGLMGLAVDPNYAENGFLYACYTYQQGNTLYNRVVRLVESSPNPMEQDGIVLENIPSASNHAGCRLRFAPDGTLFITTGDALEPEKAQDADSLAGKILRINADGSIPEDNPILFSLVYSIGHRNPQGLDWDPLTGLLYATEHGPSGFDGLPGGDEINLILAGANYGWSLVSHEEEMEGMVSPLIVFTPAEAPASGMFYSGSVFPQYARNFFFGALRGEGVVRVEISAEDPQIILFVEKIVDSVGRVRDVAEGLDGYIYFSTSNRDGRGTEYAGDDKIYRIVPR